MTTRNGAFQEFCVDCGQEAPEGFTPFCHCGGMIDVRYELAEARLRDCEDVRERYLDLLPFRHSDELVGPALDRTPCVHLENAGRELGIPRLYGKDETCLPTGTTKDRMAAVAVPYLRTCGVRSFCASSTGNSSTSFARHLKQLTDMELMLFTAEDFIARVAHTDVDQISHYGLRGASFVEAATAAIEFAAANGSVAERGFFDLGRREGLKLAFMEASEQIPHDIDWYVQAVSSGMGVLGTYKGAKELVGMGRLARTPRLLCVQQETCKPMVSAFTADSPVIRSSDLVEKPSGIASAILRGNPSRAYPYLRSAVIESNGGFLGVSESEIREARDILEGLEGLSVCFSAAAAFAGARNAARLGRFDPQHTIMVNLTGSDRKPSSTENVVWLVRSGGAWEPEEHRA